MCELNRYLTLVGVLLAAAPAFGQQSDLPNSASIDEVIVTAQRREQNAQEVGASISAIKGRRFQELSFRTVADLSEQIPNLTFATPAGESTNLALSIRGIGLNDLSDTNEGPVAVYVDDVYFGTLTAQAGQLFDLKRVEVVRGPQGTLYGRNATGGLIHFVTESPGKELTGYAEVVAGNDNRPTLYKARGLLTASGERCSDRQIVARECFDGFGYRDPVSDPHSVELFPDIIGPRQEIDNAGGSITVNWKKDELSFHSITAASSVDKVDWDGAFANPNDLFQSGQLLDAEQFSQELRTTFSADGSDYVAGLFYFADNKKGSIPFNSPSDYDTRFDQDTDAYAAFVHGERRLSGEKLELALFGRNLTDEEKIVEGFDIFDTQMLIYNHARIYGVSLV